VSVAEKRREKAQEILTDLKDAFSRLQEALELEETLIVKDASISVLNLPLNSPGS
jgi:predicted nuclease with TOPRIM domain